MNRQTAITGLVLVAMLSIFAAAEPLLPTVSERYSELGVLGPNQTISNYPTTLHVGQSFILFGYVGNHEGASTYYEVLLKLANSTVSVTNKTYAVAPVLAVYSHVLLENQSWIFPIQLSINQTGTNLKLIFELWDYNVTNMTFDYTGLHDQIHINVTN